MKLLRSITRRGFNVGTAGWFTVLKPNTWFPASRLPGNFRYRNSQSALDQTNFETASSPRIAIPGPDTRGPMHLTFIVLAAVAITSALLWWIMHP
jgi:hypothetical protein